MRKDKGLTFIKGVCVGGTMLVPGVSGGSMAMILGIYDRLIGAVSSLRRHPRQSIVFLTIFALGGGLGMFLLATPLLKLIEFFPLPTLYFFVGAVLGSIPLINKKTGIRTLSWKYLVYPPLGFLAVFLLTKIPATSLALGDTTGFAGTLLLVAVGIVLAVALVLPGISVSYLLLLLGLYDRTMHAIGEFSFSFLLPLGLGLALGILLSTKLLDRLMTHHPQSTYLIILGFLLASLLPLFPGVPMGFDIPICLLTCSAGFVSIYLLSRVG